MFGIFNWIRSWFVVKPSPPPLPPPPVPPPPNDNSIAGLKQLLLELHNKQRKTSLRYNSELENAAQKHNDWMVQNDNLSHNEGRSGVGERVTQEGYNWRAVGENIAWGQKDPEDVMNSWMNSSGHRANIMNSSYVDVGFGITKDSKGNWWWTADFGVR